jgi:predicted O-linked N-acetylglucosamine transferase (SPINDLY family)
MATGEVRRNDPCPCGSGKRFKDCHGRLAPTPALPVADKDLARTHLTRGDREAAASSARRAVERDPGDVEAWNLLGISLEALEPHAARAAWEKAVALAPREPEAHFRIGDFERRRGDHVAAIAAYRAALATGSRHPVLLNNLGLSLQAQGQLEEAAKCFGEAVEREPTLAQGHANLGDALRLQHRFAGALAAYTRALVLNPRVAQLWLNLGVCQHRTGAFDAARESFERALALEPDAPDALVNFAASLTAESRYAEALPLLRKALQLRPQDAQAQSTLLYVQQHTCDWDELEEGVARARIRLGRLDSPIVSPHSLLALPFTPAELLSAAQHWVRRQIRSPSPLPPARPSLVEGRLRIAYLGSDFRTHALANLLSEVIETHDRSRFEVFGYSFGPDDRSPARARFARAFDRFVDIRAETSEATAQRIRDDRIGVLFDTGGYVLNARSEIFALRPAPIQINAIGFPGTLGAPWYDYILGDAFVTPPDQEPHFAERFMLLPHCYLPGDGKRTIDAAPTRAQCGLPDAGFVFCCFNASYKILPDVFAIWMLLLAEVPGSVLWLLETNAQATANLRREARGRGIAPERLVFAPRVPLAQHLARHAVADLFLDTFPCNAHTTANDALFAGLPMLTCSGETFASRVSGSQLMAIGLKELVTDSPVAYQTRALELARQPEMLVRCREQVRSARETSPLFDAAGYTRALEGLLLAAWEACLRQAKNGESRRDPKAAPG